MKTFYKPILKLSIYSILIIYTLNSFSQQVNSLTSISGSSWQQLAFLNVNSSVQKDIIFIHSKCTYKKIKIKVLDAPMEIMDLTITYENGEQSKISVRSVIQPGGESRAFDLTGKLLQIKSVEINYNAVTRNGKIPKLSIYAIQ